MTDDLLDRMEALCHDLTTARLRLHVAHSANDTFAADVADSEARVAEQSLAEAVPALVARCRAAEEATRIERELRIEKQEERNALESRLARVQEAGKAANRHSYVLLTLVEANAGGDYSRTRLALDAFAKELEGQ